MIKLISELIHLVYEAALQVIRHRFAGPGEFIHTGRCAAAFIFTVTKMLQHSADSA
jgi:hypothetical protein